MAKVTERPKTAELYEADFAAWAEQQARLLQERRFDKLDLDNLIDEVEDLSRRERETVESYVETVLEHLLKLHLSPAQRPRSDWRITVARQRARLARTLTKTLRNHLGAELQGLYAGLRRPVAWQLEEDGVRRDALPNACPYTLEQILDPDWYPTNVHGLEDPTP